MGDDKLGKFFAIYSLLPLVIVVVFITVFVCRRDLHTLTYGCGVILNYLANYGLKQYLAEPRPKSRAVQFEEYGMPSSHSQFMWFVSVYMVLFIIFRWDYFESEEADHHSCADFTTGPPAWRSAGSSSC